MVFQSTRRRGQARKVKSKQAAAKLVAAGKKAKKVTGKPLPKGKPVFDQSKQPGLGGLAKKVKAQKAAKKKAKKQN